MADETHVIICGGGPTGALLSALLGKANVPNVVLEQAPDVTTDPRGIALDEDGIRALQAIGLYDQIFTQIGSSMTKFHFISGVHTDLSRQPILSIDNSTSEGGTGHPGFLLHKQPALERGIRDVIAKYSPCQLRSKCTVTGISEDADRVTVHYTDADGQDQVTFGNFLVGADGKTGYVRKKYLEPRGITMDRSEGINYEETWVALNWKMSLPTKTTHPDFPLWRLGYSPVEVYDLFFPKEFRFLCNPARPAVCGRFGLEEERLWRFEFVVHKNEDDSKMATPEETQKIIFPYLTHPGKRYGLEEDIKYPEDCIEVLRSRPFSFQARSCNEWAKGRVILAGDAAHVFPPFGGQGIASGFRDAWGLAWRLTLLYQVPQANYVEVIRAWFVERKQQLDRSLAATIRNGEYVTQSDPWKAFVRDWCLWFLQLIPSWRREMEKGSRAEGMTRYKHQKGLPFLPDGHGGMLLPQIYVYDFKTKSVRFSDDLIFAKGKKRLLQLVVLPETAEEVEKLASDVGRLPQSQFVDIHKATFLIQDHELQPSSTKLLVDQLDSVSRVATGDEFATNVTLCQGRPRPKYYDPYRMLKETRGSKFVLVRPDRFVYTACTTIESLKSALDDLDSVLQCT